MTSGPARVQAFVDRFNDGVRTKVWDDYLDALADNVRVEFAGPDGVAYDGRDAVAAAYAAQPPNDTITVLGLAAEGYVDVVEFGWDADDSGDDGTMRIAWTPDGRVATLTVETS